MTEEQAILNKTKQNFGKWKIKLEFKIHLATVQMDVAEERMTNLKERSKEIAQDEA